MVEEWGPVRGYEDLYQVSTCGQVLSLERVVRIGNATRKVGGHLLVPDDDGRHQYVRLWRGQKRQKFGIHVLMLETFVGPRPDGHQACHRDDDGFNNVMSNLYWGTPSENALDQVRNGRHRNARKTHCKRDHADWRVRPNGTRVCRSCERKNRTEMAGRI